MLKYLHTLVLAPLMATTALAAPVAANSSAPADITQIATCTGFLEGIVFDRDGGLWMLDVEGGKVFSIGSDGTCTERAHINALISGAKLAPDGSITVVGHAGMHSFVPSPGTGKVTLTDIPFAYEGEQLIGLNDLDYDQHGGAYVTAPGNSDALKPTGRVYYRSNTGEVSLFASGLAFPNGIAVAPDGDTVAITEFSAKRVLTAPSLHNKLQVGASTNVLAYVNRGTGPDGMTFLPDGRLVIANLGAGALQIVDPRFGVSDIDLPPGKGTWTTNVAIRDGYAYVVEVQQGGVWKIAIPPRQE